MTPDTETQWIAVKNLKDHETAAAIIGDFNGRSAITGHVYESSLIPNTMCVETEHGSLYLGLEERIEIEISNSI